ncbi:hypothetical protein [Paracidovorax citrulli]
MALSPSSIAAIPHREPLEIDLALQGEAVRMAHSPGVYWTGSLSF